MGFLVTIMKYRAVPMCRYTLSDTFDKVHILWSVSVFRCLDSSHLPLLFDYGLWVYFVDRHIELNDLFNILVQVNRIYILCL